MSKISPFAIHKTLIGIGGEPKSVKRLRSGDLLIETISDLQTKSFLLAKTFFNSPVTVSPHKTLNSCRGVISEPDLLSTPDAEILEGFSDQGVIQVRRITIKRDSNIIPTKHIILTFNKPKLPTTVKAGYLNCKIRPYIPNPLRCFKCQRFGHSQTSCRGQLTCSRCASVGHSSTDCTLEQKCVNCTQSHPSDSKLCQKWKIEKQIQELKTNRNISYFEARRLIVPQLTQTYAQAARPSTISTASQTDPNLSNIICPPLQCLTPISSKNPLPGTSSSVSTFSTSSSSTQDNILPSPSVILPTIQGESLLQIPIPTTTTTTSPGNNQNNLVSPLGTESHSHTTPATHNSVSTENFTESVPNESNSEHSTTTEAQQIVKRKSRNRRKRTKIPKPDIETKRIPHRSRNATPTEITDDEDMITYDVEEEELEQDPFILPEGYLRALTPSRYRNYRE
ncbi:RNA-directed DNA polymerase from mobile element jockey [Trichonephila clavipes]|nr:RNA-directed DNA polymerase from mobile element jockey [Trichonephila clavipes]